MSTSGGKQTLGRKNAPPEGTWRGSIQQLKFTSGKLWWKGNHGRIRNGSIADQSAQYRLGWKAGPGL